MPTAIITLPDGRRARLTGPTREAVLEQARRLAQPAAPEPAPAPGSEAEGLADIEAMRQRLIEREAGITRETPRETRERLTVPFLPIDDIELGGAPAEAVRALRHVREEQSVPVALALAGSATAPVAIGSRAAAALPAARSLLGRVAQAPARAAARAAPQVTGAAAGGAAAGAGLEAEREGSTLESIARAALETGGEMAVAELAGLGVGKAAATLAAPRTAIPQLRFLDPLQGTRRQVSRVVRELPERVSAAAKRLEELVPEGAAGTVERGGQLLARAAQRANQHIRRLTAEAAGQALPPLERTAERARRAIGTERLRRIGVEASAAPRELIERVMETGDAAAIKALRRNLSRRTLDDVLAVHLGRMIERSTITREGGRVLDGARLREAWRQLPEETRRLYNKSTRKAIEGLSTLGEGLAAFGRLAAHPVGGEIVEAAAVPVTTALFGLQVAVPLMIARALLAPGPLVSYLTREELPSQTKRFLGRQSVTTGFRAAAAAETEEER